MESTMENYLITVRLMSEEVNELPIASYWISGNQSFTFMNWVEKLSCRMEFFSQQWSSQLQAQLHAIDDFFRAKGQIASGEFPFRAQQMETLNVYRLEEKKQPVLLREYPVKSNQVHW